MPHSCIHCSPRSSERPRITASIAVRICAGAIEVSNGAAARAATPISGAGGFAPLRDRDRDV